MRNKLKKIQDLLKGEWNHVTNHQITSNAGKRGTTKITDMWLKRPQLLQGQRNWPKKMDIVKTNEGAKEKVKDKSVIIITTENNTFMNDQVERF